MSVKVKSKHPRHVNRLPTFFEERVYAVVREIPKGQVRSYGWIARKLGNRYLARAVGGALHRNPDPCKIPCHRVIDSSGDLGGYAWGVTRKRYLLEYEGWKPKRL